MRNFIAVLWLIVMSIMAPHCWAENQQECTDRIEKIAMKIGFLVSINREGSKFVATVDERLWGQVDFATKTGLAQTLDCALAGPGKSIPGIIYRGNMSGRTLATWDGLKLNVD